MLKGTAKAYKRAKQLRREMTLPEVLLWQQLRKAQTGHKWRKQHPAGPYDLDFYCDKAKLCVEVDGEAHNRGDNPARDERRDAYLAQHGIFTLRISAVDVLKNLEGVVTFIQHAADERVKSSPNRGGGGEADGGADDAVGG